MNNTLQRCINAASSEMKQGVPTDGETQLQMPIFAGFILTKGHSLIHCCSDSLILYSGQRVICLFLPLGPAKGDGGVGGGGGGGWVAFERP